MESELIPETINKTAPKTGSKAAHPGKYVFGDNSKNEIVTIINPSIPVILYILIDLNLSNLLISSIATIPPQQNSQALDGKRKKEALGLKARKTWFK